MRRRIAHIRLPDDGTRLWPGNARVLTPFPSRTVQFHGVESAAHEPDVTRRLRDATDTTPAHYADAAPQPARPAVMGAFISDPAPFQSYFRVHWEGLFGARANLEQGTRRLSPLANPHAYGRAEGQATMAYNPWPSASQLSPAYPDNELKAV